MTSNPAAANESRETGIKLGRDHVLIGRAASIPVSEPTPVISVAPVALPAPGRPVDLQVRISAPTTGAGLPVILLSHGGGPSNYLSSLLGYGPLVDFWAARGFAVIQPTHLTSKSLGLDASKDPGFPVSRMQDMALILDNLDVLQDAVPGLSGRLDPGRVAVAGHSFGGQTAGMLLGEQFTDADGTVVYAPDARVKAGVLLAPTGAGGDHLTPAAAAMPSLRTAEFGKMATPALVVVGDQDHATILTSRGASYSTDAYFLSPGPKSLVTLHGAEHLLGGVTGYDAAGTTDENPERLALVQRLTWAYLRSAFYQDNPAWQAARDAFADLSDLGQIESKPTGEEGPR